MQLAGVAYIYARGPASRSADDAGGDYAAVDGAETASESLNSV